MSKRLTQLLTVAAALTVCGLAQASTPKDLPSVVVKYGDLSLNTQTGVARLHARLRHAAERVCNPLNSRVLGLREQYEQCVSDAVADSVAAFDAGCADIAVLPLELYGLQSWVRLP